MALDNKEIRKLLDYLDKEGINPLNALEIVKKHNTINPSNYRTHWKMTRFTLYIWQRIKEDKANMLGKKIDSIRRVVATEKYKRNYKLYPGHKAFNEAKEVKNLNLLITDPRQFIHFKERNFVFENTKRRIPQGLIDKLR
jgi:hypothetical protein|tara:strand:- start:205 stop:624 length:420 start_codon:yes stop_codon:yes gene_type:complete